MASSFAAPARQAPFEDVLEHLPVSTTIAYCKGQIVYGPHQPSTNIFLVAAGKVKLRR